MPAPDPDPDLTLTLTLTLTFSQRLILPLTLHAMQHYSNQRLRAEACSCTADASHLVHKHAS